jgi:hypothetical protein
MAYLDNSIITVSAVLTNKGRELLASNGQLNITSFALADDEIDYSLYQPNHPKGSAFYDSAIRNTPIFEPFTDETQVLKYKLVTLASGVTQIPVISLGQSSITVNYNYSGQTVVIPSTNPSYNTTLGYTVVLSNKNVGTIAGSGLSTTTPATVPTFLGDITSNIAQVATGLQFTFTPNVSLTQTTSTRLTIIGNESGGSISIPVTVVVATNTNS